MSERSFTTDLAALPGNGRPLRVVVGWDESNTEAVEFAAWIGRSLPVSVQVVSAVESSWKKALTGKKYRRWFKDKSAQFDQESRKVLKAYVPRSQWAENASYLAERSDFKATLNESAREFSADMILLGSRTKTSKSRFRPSTMADALMHSSPVPLGLAPKGVNLSRKGITRVTYALVGAPGEAGAARGERDAFPGLAYAATFACVLGVPLRIIAFSAAERNSGVTQYAAEWNESTLGMLDRARDEAFRVATALDQNFAETLEVQSLIAVDKGWKRAVDSVKWKKGDLMCLGSEPAQQNPGVFVGDAAGEFLRFAPVPVLIYPCEAGEAAAPAQ